MFLIPQVSLTTWIIWIMLNVLYPTYIFAFVLTIVMPNITAIFWGLALTFNSPPIGLIFLVHVIAYGLIFWIIALGCSFLIDKLPYTYLRVFALILVLIILLKPTFAPIYGSGSAFGDDNVQGKTLWEWYKMVDDSENQYQQ
ncbi:hypothetical protein [Crocosphaera chwakensis]|uniref:Uncharacterized protein n=1 Tax=Crocosphaera chwakensis CCY0110 TaxID=391612 RepID=A3IYB4_9CHRO|nr:hypothetical protein [Crocosphaera chwakensis]EAZ88522.1 hypothetical protein CY0110_06509 [Crocosphaera chwakensis CCY0110]